MPNCNSTDNPAAESPPPDSDQSLEIAIHLSSAKAIADIIHICTGCADDGSESRLDELAVQTLPALVCAIQRHIEEAEQLQIEEDKRARAESRQRAEVPHAQ